MQISTGQPSADSSLTETSYCLIESVNELMQFLENMFWKKKKKTCTMFLSSFGINLLALYMYQERHSRIGCDTSYLSCDRYSE